MFKLQVIFLQVIGQEKCDSSRTVTRVNNGFFTRSIWRTINSIAWFVGLSRSHSRSGSQSVPRSERGQGGEIPHQTGWSLPCPFLKLTKSACDAIILSVFGDVFPSNFTTGSQGYSSHLVAFIFYAGVSFI